jgi:ArsR family transcriptional regulator
MPADVRRALDEGGGIEGLLSKLPDARRLESEAEVHGALADPNRLRIMHMLARSPLCVCVIRAAMDMPDSKLSYHLGVLKSAGLVVSKKRGNFITYSLSDQGSRWHEAYSG